MPTYVYEFQDEAGGQTERFHAMSQPALTEIDGRPVTRVPTGGVVSVDVAVQTHGYPYVSNQLPKNIEGCKKDKRGRPIIRSRRHENNLRARYGLMRD